MPQTVVRNCDQTQLEYQQQVIEDPYKQDQRVLDESNSASGKKPAVNDNGDLIDVNFSSVLGDHQEPDDQSDLDVELGPESFQPILIPMAPVDLDTAPSAFDAEKTEDTITYDLDIDGRSTVEAPSASYSGDHDAPDSSNINESDITLDSGPAAQDIARFQLILAPAVSSDPNITSLDREDDATLPNDGLLSPRLLLLPPIRTPLASRRPAEQFPDHRNEDASLISTRRRIPYRSVRLARLNLRDDDSASENKAPRLMSTRHRPARLNNHYLQDARQPDSNLNNCNSQNPGQPVSNLYNHRLNNHSL
ncbi:hypothetical protein PTTG_12567 [Puccinia triticina 1-1 BBBD Race 1]|uniref:Uncharacterized protein n=1 Tax=Puccinia triticina (isolate 1-1 / race 1 (BBBD)) TaxID=630390 RepID=A0A180FZ67_PUCT1|nr:hypothetical protein PTTG_12567 [Puccinia triticina 1-1 BBBD Race 1]